MQEWKDIAGYEGHYQVSNDGMIRSIKSGNSILKGDKQKNGYRRVYLWKDGAKKNMLVHRLVALAFIPNPENLTEINHIDQDKENNRVENLEWCTHLYNMNYGDVRQKISRANMGRKASSEKRRFHSIDTSKRRWINNGLIEKYVYKESVDSMIANGWKRGRKKKEVQYV